MVRDEGHALQLAEELRQLRELGANPQWVEFEGKLAEAERKHLEGLRSREVTAEKRAEHLEASYLAEELAGWRKAKMDSLTLALEAWRRGQDEVDVRVSDGL